MRDKIFALLHRGIWAASAYRNTLGMLVAAFLLPALLAVEPASAAIAQASTRFKQQCEQRLPAAQIKVSIKESPLVESHTDSYRQLSERQVEFGQRGYAVGLTSGQVAMQFHSGARLLQDPLSSFACTRPQIELTLYLNQHKISIAREIPEGTCAYLAVMSHEQQHVALNRQNLAWIAARMEAEMTAYYRDQIAYGSSSELRIWLSDTVKGYWLQRLKQLEAAARERHRQIDTEEEYKRTNTVCDGEIPRYLSRKY